MENRFKIEKGVDIPPDTNRGRRLKYPWSEMEVGDSFLVTLEKYDKRRQAVLQTASRSWSTRNKEGKWKFTVRREGENIRIWRII